LPGNATLNQWDCLSSRADTFSSKTGEPAGLLLLAFNLSKSNGKRVVPF
jgi:hypothetical protein